VRIEGVDPKYFIEVTEEELLTIVTDLLSQSRYQRDIEVIPGLKVTYQTLLAEETDKLYQEIAEIRGEGDEDIPQALFLQKTAKVNIKYYISEIFGTMGKEVTLEKINKLPQPIIGELSRWMSVFDKLVARACQTVPLGN